MTNTSKPKIKLSKEELLRQKLEKRETAHNFLIYSNKPQSSQIEPIESQGIGDLPTEGEGAGELPPAKEETIKQNTETDNEKKVESSGIRETEQSTTDGLEVATANKQELLTVKKRRTTRTFKKIQPKKSDRYTPKTFRVDKEVLEMFEKYMDIEHGDYQKIINLSLINAMLSDEFISQRILNQSVEEYNRLIELEEEYQEM